MGKSDQRHITLKPISMPATPSHSPTPSRKSSKAQTASKPKPPKVSIDHLK